MLMALSCYLTLLLSFLWIKPSVFVYFLTSIGTFIQLIALIKFQQIITSIKSDLSKKLTTFIFRLLQFFYILFTLKIVLQLITSIPYFEN